MNKARISRLANNVFAPLGLFLVLLATIVPFFLHRQAWAMASYPYIYSAGALVVLVARFFTCRSDKDLRLRRLRRLEVWCGIIFAVGAFFLFYPGASATDWLAFTLAGAALQIYTSIAIPAREAKVAKHKEQ